MYRLLMVLVPTLGFSTSAAAQSFFPVAATSAIPMMPIWAFLLLVVVLVGVTWWLRPGGSR